MVDMGAHTVKRWINLDHSVRQLFDKFKPELIIIEDNFVHKNVRSTAGLNQLRGAVLLLAALHGVKVNIIDNNTAKKKVLGGTRYWNGSKYAGVTKDMMLTAVKDYLCPESVLPVTDDAADAIALALVYYEASLTPKPLARKPSK